MSKVIKVSKGSEVLEVILDSVANASSEMVGLGLSTIDRRGPDFFISPYSDPIENNTQREELEELLTTDFHEIREQVATVYADQELRDSLVIDLGLRYRSSRRHSIISCVGSLDRIARDTLTEMKRA